MSKVARLREMREAKFEKPKADRVNNRRPLFTSPPDIIAEQPKRRGKSNAERQAKWREANTETARKRTRDAMRKKRAKA